VQIYKNSVQNFAFRIPSAGTCHGMSLHCQLLPGVEPRHGVADTL